MKETQVCLLVADTDPLGLSMDSFFVGESEDELDLDQLFEPHEDTSEDPSNPELDPEVLLGLKKEESTEDPDPNDIFGIGTESPESVSRDKEDKSDQGPEDTKTEGDNLSSNAFYSSILSSLREDGVLPDIDEDFVKNAQTPEDFAEAIEKQVEARLDETTKRIKDALEGGIDPDIVLQYEDTINQLNAIEDSRIEGEDEESENLRKNLIRQEYLSRGLSKERAEREVNKSFNAGTDIEDAKDALSALKKTYQDGYNDLTKQAQDNKRAQEKAVKEAREKFKTQVLDTEEPLKGIKVDKKTRQQMWDNATKPIHKDENGNMYSAVQKYMNENPVEAQYYFNLFYTMTNGFKEAERIAKPIVNKEKNKSVRELEHRLRRNSSFQDSGNDLFVPSNKDPNSKIIIDI